jgi:hypothetical protein
VNFAASSPESFFALASRSQCKDELCFFAAGVALEAGVAVGVASVLAANALPAVSSAARVRVESNFMGISDSAADRSGRQVATRGMSGR